MSTPRTLTFFLSSKFGADSVGESSPVNVFAGVLNE